MGRLVTACWAFEGPDRVYPNTPREQKDSHICSIWAAKDSEIVKCGPHMFMESVKVASGVEGAYGLEFSLGLRALQV